MKLRNFQFIPRLKLVGFLETNTHKAVRNLYKWAAIRTIRSHYTITTARVKNELLISPEKYYSLLHVVTEGVIQF